MSNDPPAHWYPNLTATLMVKVLGHPKVGATTDQGCASHETRHFIDYNYLRSLQPEGPALLESLVTPTPPCQKLTGTIKDGGEEVVGMLKERLRVSLYLEAAAVYDPNYFNDRERSSEDERERYPKGWLDLKLQNVLVIRDLPVPFHLSLKRAKMWVSLPHSTRINPRCFPEAFRSHIYWQPSAERPLSVGSVAFLGEERAVQLRQDIQSAATGRETKAYPPCKNCGGKNRKLLCCSVCKRAWYCSKKCQTQGVYLSGKFWKLCSLVTC